MANGDVKKINESRIAIEVDDMSYVIDLQPGQEQVEVVTAFMAKWEEKHRRDRKLIAAAEARRRREASEKRKEAIDAIMDMSDEEIEVLTAPKEAIKFAFAGFDDIPELPNKEVKPDVNDSKPDRSGGAVSSGRVEPKSVVGSEPTDS